MAAKAGLRFTPTPSLGEAGGEKGHPEAPVGSASGLDSSPALLLD